jgi:hypothetical protein
MYFEKEQRINNGVQFNTLHLYAWFKRQNGIFIKLPEVNIIEDTNSPKRNCIRVSEELLGFILPDEMVIPVEVYGAKYREV